MNKNTSFYLLAVLLLVQSTDSQAMLAAGTAFLAKNKRAIIGVAALSAGLLSYGIYKSLVAHPENKVSFQETIDEKSFKSLNITYLNELQSEVSQSLVPPITSADLEDQNVQRYADLLDKKYEVPHVIAFINKDVGYGVFASENIEKGQMVGEYTGILKMGTNSSTIADCAYA